VTVTDSGIDSDSASNGDTAVEKNFTEKPTF